MEDGSRDHGAEHVKSVAEACRDWLSSPLNVGLALASGLLGAALVEPIPGQATNLERVPLALVKDSFRTSLESPRSKPFDHVGSGLEGETGYAELTGAGLRVFGEGGAHVGPVVTLSRREIERAQRMATAFRLPESVALRWGIGREFSIDFHLMRVMPSAQWAHHKWRVLWIGSQRWAVKGSPSRSTFANLIANKTETLMQDEIAKRIAGLGLKIGG